MLAEVGVVPRFGQRLAAVTKAGQRITQIAMDDGTIYRAKMFIDASYEGDLMAMAGVSWTIGRESTVQYGESLNGIRASTPAHQFTVNVDPYIVPGNAGSGLLPFIQPGNGGTPGDGDGRVQAYNYRLCLTNNAGNRIAIAAPAGYSEAQYELFGRYIDARTAAGQSNALTSFMNISAMPNSKTDINNNGAFSTDFIGMSDSYALSTYAQRAVIDQQHRDYIQGFLYYLGHSTRVPLATRNSMLAYGWCADEFTTNGGWGELYVREARRMISDYVMLQQNCQGTRVAADPIGLGSYTMDSHNCQRIVQGGWVRNEGDVQSGSVIYGIAYRSLIPRVGECENLVVPWALSASHMGFGSIRMEPVFMIMGQSAATAAAFAIDDNLTVQQLAYPKLALQLTADGQALPAGTSGGAGIIVDNADATGVTVIGSWTASSATAGFWGVDYLHDENADKGTKSVRFTPDLPAAGEYDVQLRWTAHTNRATIPAGATTASISVQAIGDALAEGTETLTVTLQPGAGYSIGPLGAATAQLLDRPIDAWRHAHFSAAQLADPAISGDLADADADGLSNLEEYPLALDPLRPDAESAPVAAWDGTALKLSYSRLRSATDVAVIAEGAYDAGGAWGAAGVVEEIARVDHGATERVTVRLIPAGVPAERGFLRVRVQR